MGGILAVLQGLIRCWVRSRSFKGYREHKYVLKAFILGFRWVSCGSQRNALRALPSASLLLDLVVWGLR